MQLLPLLSVVESWRAWISSTGSVAEPQRWFCSPRGQVVVEEHGHASAFRVVNGRVVRYQQFDSLHAALSATSLSDEDEVLS